MFGSDSIMATNNKVWTVIGGVVLVCLLLAVLPKAPAPGRLGAGAPAPIVEFYGEVRALDRL